MLGVLGREVGVDRRFGDVIDRVVAFAVVAFGMVRAWGIPFPAARVEALAMVVVLAVTAWFACAGRGFGPAGPGRSARLVRVAGFAVVAGSVLLFLETLRAPRGADATTQIAVWTVVHGSYLAAVAALTARRSAVPRRALAAGVGAGLAGAVGWLAVVLVWPSLPTTSAPALVAAVVAALAAVAASAGRAGPTAALSAGATTALLVDLLADDLLPGFTRWVAHNAPPLTASDHAQRLADPVAVLLVGALLAGALAIRGVMSRPGTAPTRT